MRFSSSVLAILVIISVGLLSSSQSAAQDIKEQAKQALKKIEAAKKVERRFNLSTLRGQEGFIKVIAVEGVTSGLAKNLCLFICDNQQKRASEECAEDVAASVSETSTTEDWLQGVAVELGCLLGVFDDWAKCVDKCD
ncbi:MAG: hypothetical protein ETSY1_08815 [Candidatus Entotheonella factor]|uniref:Uncharacterized protein n=1 Tax=Entotheonella factor TaxID=1429438 RepID=W4LSR1_ENTF1|nr:MAG: hypothetical protein ETSY1_08815 [Candidatus Entotheonella factor]